MTAEEITTRLAEPFEAGEVKFKPAVVSGNRALALAYVDARVIQDRLDDVLGVVGWQDSYKVLPDGSVMCRLRCKIGEQWITKMDVGGQSEQPDEGDRAKAAVSDALKRAAVKFGVGRYLYRLPQTWCDYDPTKRQFVKVPQLPAHAVKAAKVAPMSHEVQVWVKLLATNPDMPTLNAECAKALTLMKVGKDKQQAWALIEKYAHNRGWTFNTESKQFGEVRK